MLKRMKQWYVDTPRFLRYGWGYTISGAVGLVAFFSKLAAGVSFDSAFNSGLMLYFVNAMLVLVGFQALFDSVRKYWKKGTVPDEMEKRINHQAARIGFMANSIYLATMVCGVGFVAEKQEMDCIPVNVLHDWLFYVIWSALLLFMVTQGISLVVLYSRQSS